MPHALDEPPAEVHYREYLWQEGRDGKSDIADDPAGHAVSRRPVSEMALRPVGDLVVEERLGFGPIEHSADVVPPDVGVRGQRSKLVQIAVVKATEIEPQGGDAPRRLSDRWLQIRHAHVFRLSPNNNTQSVNDVAFSRRT